MRCTTHRPPALRDLRKGAENCLGVFGLLCEPCVKLERRDVRDAYEIRRDDGAGGRVGCQNSVPPANRHGAREDTVLAPDWVTAFLNLTSRAGVVALGNGD